MELKGVARCPIPDADSTEFSKGDDTMKINIKEKLLNEINTTSDSTLKEVLDFLLFIKAKEAQQEQLEISLLSEPLLAEDWLTPEEDEAWQHL
jgi:hypothetical protein